VSCVSHTRASGPYSEFISWVGVRCYW